MRSRPDDEAMAEVYRSDPALALDIINSILADGDQAELLAMLRQMAQAFRGVQGWPISASSSVFVSTVRPFTPHCR